jgi:group I intron endonuclease
MQGLIYSIYSRDADKHYIGSTTKPLNKEWKEHLDKANRMSSKHLYKAIRKYGAGSFTLKVLEECHESLLDEKLSYWIEQYDAYNKGYNIKPKEIPSPIIDPSPIISEPVDEVKPKKKKSPFGNRTYKHCGIHHKRAIKTINVNTLEENVYESLNECAEALGVIPSNLSRSMNNGWKVKGHRIIKLDDRPISKQIYGLDKRTNRIRFTFNSIREACDTLEGCQSGCHKSLKHPHKYSWCGCYWFYVHPISAPPTAAPTGTDQT